jgi:hypothetical protein
MDRRRKHPGHGAGIAFLLVCLLLAQFHASAHLHSAWFAAQGKRAPAQSPHGSSGPDCQGCVTGAWTAPTSLPHLDLPAPSQWIETNPRPFFSSLDFIQPTAPRAPPLG